MGRASSLLRMLQRSTGPLTAETSSGRLNLSFVPLPCALAMCPYHVPLLCLPVAEKAKSPRGQLVKMSSHCNLGPSTHQYVTPALLAYADSQLSMHSAVVKWLCKTAEDKEVQLHVKGWGSDARLHSAACQGHQTSGPSHAQVTSMP